MSGANGAGAPAVVLLSGGLDSTTVLAYAIDAGFIAHAMTFRYGQRHTIEIESARRIARAYDVRDHIVVDIDLRTFGGSALTSDLAVPKDRTAGEMQHGIPITYVPARNTIFLSYALAWSEVLEASDIFIGVNAIDYSGYPDCRPEYVAAFERMANLATRGAVEGTTPVRIRAPFIDLTKQEIIELGLRLGVDYSLTSSCYDPLPGGVACGRCDACRLRLDAFARVGTSDPVRYA
jgi:7-cyano-7-deazaguanine synthase